MTPPEAIDPAALRRLAAKATPGPWHFYAEQGGDGHITQTSHITRDVWTIPHNDVDLPYIAAANPRTVMALIDRLAAAEEAIQAGCLLCANLDNGGHGHASLVAHYRDKVDAYDRAIAGQQQRQEGTTDA